MDENDNTPYLSSLELSKVLGKRHDHVLRDIEVEQESVENILKRCSDDQMLSNLARKFLIGLKESSYVDTKGRTQKAYLMSGFTAVQLLMRYSLPTRLVLSRQFPDIQESLRNFPNLATILDSLKADKSVYVIQDSERELIKIGVASDPEARLVQLQTGNPFELSLAYCSSVCHNAFEVEAEIHKVLAGFHIRGEWFSATPDKAIEEINRLVN